MSNVTKRKNLPLSKRGMSFETFMWVFTRLSALAMYALALIGLIGALVMGGRHHMNFAQVMIWAFSTNAHHVHGTTIPDMAPWATWFWKAVAAVFLLVATAHGVHGLVVIADDYIISERGRKVVRIISMVSMGLFSLIGLFVLWKS